MARSFAPVVCLRKFHGKGIKLEMFSLRYESILNGVVAMWGRVNPKVPGSNRRQDLLFLFFLFFSFLFCLVCLFVLSCLLFFLGNVGQENVFYDFLERKNALLDYKNKKFKNSKNWHFCKGFNPWFWSNMAIFQIFIFKEIQAKRMSFTIF